MSQSTSFPGELPASAGREANDRKRAIRELRAARRRRYFDSLAWIDTLYRLYLTAILSGVAIALISGALGDAPADAHAVDVITEHGPAVVGVLIALAVAAGWRAGGRGGPLAIEAADVQHVLLAPVDRTAFLRRIAIRRLWSMAFAGLIVGLIVGNLAFRRLPGPTAEWLACDAAVGALVALVALSVAMIASGYRLKQWTVNLLAASIVAFALADLVFNLDTGRTNSATIGELALWPLRSGDASLVDLLPTLLTALAAVFLGLRGIGGTSLSAARRRAALTEGLRFAITLQDVRAVILLRRQLADELPRRRPWKRLNVASPSRKIVWRRDWQSFLRWPAVRVARVGLLGAIAGAALCGVWSGTTPLVVVAGLALLVAGLEAVEPLAQETDHPTRARLLPLRPEVLARRHLVAPAALMLTVTLAAIATASFVGEAGTALEIGGVLAIPTTLLVVCSAALSVTNDPFKYLLVPAAGYAQSAFPAVLAVASVLPVVAAREAAEHHSSAVAAAGGSALLIVVVAAAVIWVLERRMAEQLPVSP